MDAVVAETSADGPFVNWAVQKGAFIKTTLKSLVQRPQTYGENTVKKGQTIIVEYSSPNIAKPFHAGHLRSTVIGNFMVNVFKANGAKTISYNYLGDWGKQYGTASFRFALQQVKEPTRF